MESHSEQHEEPNQGGTAHLLEKRRLAATMNRNG